MMSQILKGPEARIAIELMRTEGEVLIARLDPESCMVELATLPREYDEKLPHVGPSAYAHRFFDREWVPLLKNGKPYPVADAVRKLITGTLVPPQGFKTGALSAVADCLPSGEQHLFGVDEGFVGRFASIEDARLIGKALATEFVVFGSPEEFSQLPLPAQQYVIAHLDPERSAPTKSLTKKQSIGIFDMAKAAAKKKAKKVVKVQNKIKRADGPVAKARAIFEKMKEKDTPAILAACDEAKINRGTATTQLGRWRKENGIVVKRGGPRDHAKKKDAPAAASKKDAKKDGKKDAKKKSTGVPSTPAALKEQAAKPAEDQQKPADAPATDKPADAAPAATTGGDAPK